MEQLTNLYNYLHPNQEKWAEETIQGWVRRYKDRDIVIVNLFHIHGVTPPFRDDPPPPQQETNHHPK